MKEFENRSLVAEVMIKKERGYFLKHGLQRFFRDCAVCMYT